MQETTNEIILEAVATFRDKPVTQEALNEFCSRRNIEPMTLGQLDDHLYQVKHDERMAQIYPLVLAELAKIKYYGEYMSEVQAKNRIKELDEIEDAIVKIFTDAELPYRLISTSVKELDGIINKMLETSKTRVSNLCVGVMLKITEKHFGDKEFTVGDAQRYYDEKKAEIDKSAE